MSSARLFMSASGYLEHLASEGVAYLHPGGSAYTSRVVDHLQLQPGMHILEIGCGTAATLADLTRFPGISLSGIDASTAMLLTARERLNSCRLNQQIALHQAVQGEPLPFADNTVDAAFAESVLAIVDAQLLQGVLREVYRILKPGGRLMTNDAIWKKGTSPEVITQINDRCCTDFAIVQSCAKPATVDEWLHTFEQAGFNILENEVNPPASGQWTTLPASGRFSWRKKFKARLNPLHWLRHWHFTRMLRTRHSGDGKHLENRLFVIQKPVDPQYTTKK